jgi:hypothetical protein
MRIFLLDLPLILLSRGQLAAVIDAPLQIHFAEFRGFWEWPEKRVSWAA